MHPAAIGEAAWAGRRAWRILQTDFGSGRAFLAHRQAWRDDPQRSLLLHFVAVRPDASELEPELAQHCTGLTPGFHRFPFDDGRVLLTLCVGELLPMLREQDFHADALLLEHPQADLATLKSLTRLGRRGTQLLGARADAHVQQDLQSCGWRCERASDGGLVASLDPAWPVKGLAPADESPAGDAIVIGAGLSGAAVAASLASRGWQVRVLDAAGEPAAGASSLPAGLMAPHQTPDDNLLSRLSRAGIRITWSAAQVHLARGLEWDATGVLESRGEDRRTLPDLGEALQPWSREASEAQRTRAGWSSSQPAWWHAQAAWIEPRALVRAWLRRPGVRFEGGVHVHRVVPGQDTRWRVEDVHGASLGEARLVVVAAALASAALLPRLQVHPVRGQVTWAPHGEGAGGLPPFPVNGNGHFLPRLPLLERGAWLSGSTYGRNEDDASVRGEDTAANLQRARELVPAAKAAIDAAAARGELRAWAGVRCASSDRRPLVGEAAPGLWVSTAMGSRGLTFAGLCAELLAARLHGEPLPVEVRLAQALDAARQPGFTPG